MYKYFKCEEDEYYFVITNATEYIPYCSDCSDWPKLDNVTLEINLPVAAAEHNADSVKDTKYIWEYGKDALSGKNFYLKISKLSLSESHEKYLKKQEQIKIIKKTVGIMALIIFFAVIIFVCIKLKNKYKENQLEY